jgi:hypothetical protein
MGGCARRSRGFAFAVFFIHFDHSWHGPGFFMTERKPFDAAVRRFLDEQAVAAGALPPATSNEEFNDACVGKPRVDCRFAQWR